MNELLRFAVVTIGSMLFIVDPVAVIPTYLVITQDESPAERRRTARRACLAMVVLLTAFAAAGTALFSVLGITLPAFRTAGGLILWFVALDMLHGERRTQEGRDEGRKEPPRKTWPSPRSPSRCSRGQGQSRP